MRDTTADQVQYGTYTYGTSCGRFQLFKNVASTSTAVAGTWEIIECESHEYSGLWYRWLERNGLWDAVFSTRRATLEALTYMLRGDDLMDADKPS